MNRLHRATALAGALTTLTIMGTISAQAQQNIPIGICQSTAQGPAKFATALWKGAEIAIKEINDGGGINGAKLEPVPVDVGNNDPAQARLSFNKAFQINKIKALVCWGTNVMVQNGPLIDENDVAAFTMSSGLNVVKAAKLAQQLEATTDLQCRIAAKKAKEKYPEIKRLAVLFVNYEFGIEMRDQCGIEFGKVGIELVASEGHSNAPTDLRAQVTKLLQAKPDAIYLAPIGGGTIPLGIRAGRELGFKGLFMTYTSGDTPDVYNLKLAESGFFFVSHDVPAEAPRGVAEAVTTYGGYAGAGYDYAWLVGSVARELAKEGKPITGTNLIARVREKGTIKTPVNEYRFKPTGYTVRPLAIFTVANSARKLERPFTAQELE